MSFAQKVPNSSALIDVFALVRISDAGGAKDDKFGGPRQLAAIDVARQAHGLNIIKTFIVTDVSGRHAEEDSDFQEIFAGFRSGIARGLVVAEQSRIFRPDGMRQYGILANFEENDARIYTPTGVLDLNTTEGRINTVVTGLMSGEELHKLRERCDGAKEKRRQAGLHPNGPQNLPRGVRYVRVRDENDQVTDTIWKHDGVDSERMRIAFEKLTEEDMPYTHIAELIGGGWSPWGVKHSMMNPIWKGYRLYKWEAKGPEFRPKNGKPDKNGKVKMRRKQTERPEPLLVKIDIPSLVTDAVWERAQVIIAQREGVHRKTRVKNYDKPRHGLNSLAYCSCGCRLYPKFSGHTSQLDTYYCSAKCGAKRYKRVDLDGTVDDMISHNLCTGDYVIATLEQVVDAAVDPGRAQREAALNAVRKARENLLDLRLSNDVTKVKFVERDRVLEKEERSLQTLLPMPRPKKKPQNLAAEIARVFAEFTFLSPQKKRALLQRAVREIIVDASTIPSVILKGGFLTGANSLLRRTPQSPIDALSDVVIRFPKPLEIKAIYIDGRKNGKRWAS